MSERKMRTSEGRWIGPCYSGPPSTAPVVIEREKRALEEFKASITPEIYREMVMMAIKEAREGEGRPQENAKAWLAKYLVGDPKQITDLLYKKDNDFEIVFKLDEDEENGS